MEIMTVSELLICDLITTSKQKIRFILCYRPPQYDIELAEHMCNEIASVSKLSHCV